jgi:hypothetical protein
MSNFDQTLDSLRLRAVALETIRKCGVPNLARRQEEHALKATI